MWEWLKSETEKIVEHMRMSPQDKGDTISETLYELFSKPKLAQDIYNTHNVKRLYGVIHNIRSTKLTATQYYDNARDFFRYCDILNVSKEYDIQPTVENAYIFASILGKPYSICFVATLIMNKKPMMLEYDANCART